MAITIRNPIPKVTVTFTPRNTEKPKATTGVFLWDLNAYGKKRDSEGFVTRIIQFVKGLDFPSPKLSVTSTYSPVKVTQKRPFDTGSTPETTDVSHKRRRVEEPAPSYNQGYSSPVSVASFTPTKLLSTELIVWDDTLSSSSPSYKKTSMPYASVVVIPEPVIYPSYSSRPRSLSESSTEFSSPLESSSEDLKSQEARLNESCRELVLKLKSNQGALSMIPELNKDSFKQSEMQQFLRALLLQACVEYERKDLQARHVGKMLVLDTTETMNSARGIIKTILELAITHLTPEELGTFIQSRPVDSFKSAQEPSLSRDLKALFVGDLKLAIELAKRLNRDLQADSVPDDQRELQVRAVLNAIFEHYTPDQQLNIFNSSKLDAEYKGAVKFSQDQTPKRNLKHKIDHLDGLISRDSSFYQWVRDAIPEGVKSGGVEDRDSSVNLGSVSRSLFSEESIETAVISVRQGGGDGPSVTEIALSQKVANLWVAYDRQTEHVDLQTKKLNVAREENSKLKARLTQLAQHSKPTSFSVLPLDDSEKENRSRENRSELPHAPDEEIAFLREQNLLLAQKLERTIRAFGKQAETTEVYKERAKNEREEKVALVRQLHTATLVV